MEKSNSNDSNCSSKSSHNLIYCFICGIAYKKSHFVNHYRECKENYVTNPNFSERPIKEPEIFNELLLKIENKEDATEALNEYKKMVESLHFDLIYKECPNCEQQLYPNEYLTHIKTCSLRKSLTFESHHESEYKEDNVIEYVRDRCQRKRRKMSMENLKSIAKDEVKSFKSFNILRYKNKEQL